jgi:hypothetical protein
VIHEKAESAIGKVVVIPLQQIAAQLIHDDDDYELGLCVISAGIGGNGPQAEHKESNGVLELAAHTMTSVFQQR